MGKCVICEKQFFNKTAVMFVYLELNEEDDEKRIYRGKDLACLLHFTLFGKNCNRAPKKRKIMEDEEISDVKVEKQE